MSNIIEITDLCAKEGVAEFETEAMFVNTVDRSWEPEFKQSAYEPGTQIRVRRPARYVATEGEVASVQDHKEDHIDLTLRQFHVATRWRDVEKQLSLGPKKLAERVFRPMANELMSKVETFIAQTMAEGALLDAGNTPGVVPGSFASMADGMARLLEQRPGQSSEVFGALTYTSQARLLDNTKAIPNPTTTLSSQYVKGKVKNIAGINTFGSPSIYRLENGTQVNSDTPLVNGTLVHGTNTIILKSAGASKTWTKGMALKVAGVYEIDPQSRQALPHLKVFRAASAGTTDGSGDGTVTITEYIYTSGTLQNVSGAGSTDAAVTWMNGGAASSKSYQNLIYVPRSYAFVALPLALPEIKGLATIRDEYGIPIKSEFWRDGGNSKEYLRMDILIAGAVTRGQWIAANWGE